MRVLIVESDPGLGDVWQRHIERQGCRVSRASSEGEAIAALRDAKTPVNVIILNLFLQGGSALAVADYASYRHPEARVIFVTSTSFFSDGSLFALAPNACAYVRTNTPPEDLAAMAGHYAAN
ncbi:Response regulator receiver domain protein [Pseudoruegeria aquimaris]|uniref:Response regulator receiver domain protein n=1 Tax=Pseudoruegeria aquimaris TaxID=393663 RepID=A0A1Y5S521_9RHOB|nr:response regulator [Pseudoruegeria aquimaris]SLN29969.1 Response regulator receiver domain protein [Pseudoruegeria aquimaris]